MVPGSVFCASLKVPSRCAGTAMRLDTAERSPVPCFLLFLQGVDGTALFLMAIESKFNEARDQIAIANPGRLPQFRVHADLSEPGQRVDLVEEDAAFAVRLHEKVDASQAGKIA